MSALAGDYPASVAAAFGAPRALLPAGRRGEATLLAQARTPASAEWACLYALDGRWQWRALASPWLVAALEALCAAGPVCEAGPAGEAGPASEAELEQALKGLHLPPVKRYCAVLARELWQQAHAAAVATQASQPASPDRAATQER